MSLEHFENAVNEVSDKDWSWWPFLWLRPEKHEEMGLPRLAMVSILFGAPIGAFMTILAAMINPEAKAFTPVLIGIFPLILFFIASVLVAPMWNRRAERLRAKPEAFRRG